MHHIAKKGLVAALATGSSLFAGVGAAHADSGAHGTAAGSPGVLSGNSVQAPVNVPVNVCGNTVNVVGLLNPTFGNHCANGGGSVTPAPPVTPPTGHHPKPPTGPSQPPVTPPGHHPGHHHPGHHCPPGHHPGSHTPPAAPPKHQQPPATPVHHAPPAAEVPPAPSTATHEVTSPAPKAVPAAASLAHTGSAINPATVLPVAAGALLGGGLLYRRFRPGSR
ncbi:hypothetical protein BIV57_18210 [Mangrovactinospora gilvigrisea]|uniref:Chaplin domain-containing protein n=1 Tax=Mangrovactinospora gilvigrisea TaxID=1428644 RepID=A0A1J7BBX4_9ACTN|nr:chaplin [Mangrovactinospora gilvigrisea]OIV36093.1 hypothetical protein BIV57_18210 [Mangrovactinospora gilvigrisea]